MILEFLSQDKSSAVGNPAHVQERGAMHYYIATACVSAGQIDRALDYLRLALNEGFAEARKVASDTSFVALRDNPGFQKLLAEETAR